MSFGEWVQRRRVHALVLTIPVCTAASIMGAVIFQVFPRSTLWSRRFFLDTIVWGVCLGVVLAFALRPLRFLRKE